MMLGSSDLQKILARDMSETELDRHIMEMAETRGWLHYHVFEQRVPARRSSKGFPDWVLVHPVYGRTIYVESKSQKGQMSKDQKLWANCLILAGNEHHIWRPSDWFSGKIEAILSE